MAEFISGVLKSKYEKVMKKKAKKYFFDKLFAIREKLQELSQKDGVPELEWQLWIDQYNFLLKINGQEEITIEDVKKGNAKWPVKWEPVKLSPIAIIVSPCIDFEPIYGLIQLFYDGDIVVYNSIEALIYKLSQGSRELSGIISLRLKTNKLSMPIDNIIRNNLGLMMNYDDFQINLVLDNLPPCCDYIYTGSYDLIRKIDEITN